MNTIYAFLSWDWAGLVLSVAIAVPGWLIWRQGRLAIGVWKKRLQTVIGGFIAVLGGALIISSGIHAVSVEMAFAKYPAPGKLVDVNGYNMHLLAEEPDNYRAGGKNHPTLLWIPGGHSSGYNFYNMHKVFRNETRSIIFDRLSTGWSDRGPYPRTSYREVEELHQMLTKAGETGPLILVGHSYGGLLAALYAMHHPEQIAGLVLLDSGLAVNWENPVAANFMLQYSKALFYDGLLQAFGIPLSLQARAGGDMLKELLAIYESQLKDVWPEISALNRAAMNAFGTASIFTEVGTPEFFERGAMQAGVLNGKPLTYITFLGSLDLSFQQARDEVRAITGLDAAGVDGQIKGLMRNRRAMSALSDQFHPVSVPAGASHNFPYETPDFVVDHVRQVIDLVKNQ